MKPFRLIAAPMLLCSMLLLTGCAELFPKSGQNVNTVPPTVPAGETTSVLPEDWVVTTAPTENLEVESLTMVVTESTIRELDNYPNLKHLDLSGSTCYTAIMVYIQSHPQVDVTYTVDLGSTWAAEWVEQMSLPADGTSFDILRSKLVSLPQLSTLHLPKTGLSYSEIQMLRTA